MPVKQVIIVRTKFPDGKGGHFGMRLGKIAAQVAHASLKVFFDRKVESRWFQFLGNLPFFRTFRYLLVIPLTREMAEWVFGTFTKIVVGVETEQDLLNAHAFAIGAGIPTSLIRDLGATEFHGVPTYTTCAIGPADSEIIDRITGAEGAVRVRLL